MALIVEDGTGVDNANTYQSRADLIAYAAARGVTLVDDATTDILAIKAMDYIETFRGRFTGTPVDDDQPLSWSRTSAYVYGRPISATAIPIQLKQAEAQLVIILFNGVDLMPVVDNTAAFVKREKVDVLEIEYSESIKLAAGELPVMPQIDALLQPLLSGGGFTLSSIRV